MAIPKKIGSKSKSMASFSVSLKRRLSKAKKIRANRAKKIGCTNRGPPPKRYNFDPKEAYANQCKRCALDALTHFNEIASTKMGVTYELVESGPSTPLAHNKGFAFHVNFLARPKNSVDDSDIMLFFGELWRDCQKRPHVTNCCILGSADSVCLGNNGCEACGPKLHHPSEGYVFWE